MFHSSKEVIQSAYLYHIGWIKKTETRNSCRTYPSTCFLYLPLDSYLLECKSTLEVKFWKQMLVSRTEPEAATAALGPAGYMVPNLEEYQKSAQDQGTHG